MLKILLGPTKKVGDERRMEHIFFVRDLRAKNCLLLVAFVGVMTLLPRASSAFRTTNSFGRRSLMVLRDQQQPPPKEVGIATTIPSPAENTWNASGSFGTLVMNMQKSEEALLAANKGLNLTDQVVQLDPISGKQKGESKVERSDEEEEIGFDQSEQLPFMDVETARELDASVIPLTGSREALIQDLKILPLNPLYECLNQQQATSPTLKPPLEEKKIGGTLPFSRPEHYLYRIDRDRRHLSVSIAASTEEISQWRLFCQERGGLFPILETIREGARSIGSSEEVAEEDSWTSNGSDHQEETFRAACSACRVLRDLCAISPELAAVITDGILRANKTWNGGLMEDFRTILKYASEYSIEVGAAAPNSSKRILLRFRNRRDMRLRCKLYVTQLLLAMVVASDDAVSAIRDTHGLSPAILECSSYARKEQTRRWLRYPGEIVKWTWRRLKSGGKKRSENIRRPFLEAATLTNDLNGQVQRSSNQILAAIGYNKWVPKIPGQKGLRILCLDGGGSRGMAAITAVNFIMETVDNGADVADSFDMIVGTSTGGIIAFLVGLQRETSAQALIRYQHLIDKIFVKSALSTPLMLFTTATYDESHFMSILMNILGEKTMLDSRADPATPLVCCLTSKMSSTPTHVALFRNYNYAAGELADPFTIDPDAARADLDLPLELEHETIRKGFYVRRKTKTVKAPGKKIGTASRHPGSFRVLQRYALRASTAAPTVFKPVMMGGEMYCDGGIVASNPAAVALHEARSIFPDIPIELVVSVGTGAFLEQKSAPRVGWDGIIGQIVNSATDGEQIHHILEDILGQSAVLGDKKSAVSKTRYFRFNPVVGLPDEFPIDVTDPGKLAKLRKITTDYMQENEQQEKIDQIRSILKGRKSRKRRRSDISR
jgi:predicted acylesterase/phospholipase RssA